MKKTHTRKATRRKSCAAGSLYICDKSKWKEIKGRCARAISIPISLFREITQSSPQFIYIEAADAAAHTNIFYITTERFVNTLARVLQYHFIHSHRARPPYRALSLAFVDLQAPAVCSNHLRRSIFDWVQSDAAVFKITGALTRTLIHRIRFIQTNKHDK